MAGSAQTHDAVVREILGEKAGTLARAVHALERALDELRRADRAASTATAADGPARSGHQANRAAARRRDALAHAGERLWVVVIQREAMGLLRHEVLYDVLAVPAEVRLHMGPRRRG